MAKLTWEISREGYGVQFEVVANTRSNAIANAEARFLFDTAWEDEVVGQVADDGVVITRSPIPEFKAKKLPSSHCSN